MKRVLAIGGIVLGSVAALYASYRVGKHVGSSAPAPTEKPKG